MPSFRTTSRAHEEAVARKKAAEKQRQEEQAKVIRTHDEYVSNLNKVYMYMMGGAVTSETACNLTSGVWHDAIFGGWDDETSPYQASDFNDALKKLYESEKYQGYVSSIEDGNDKIDDIMRDLTSRLPASRPTPPEATRPTPRSSRRPTQP